MFDTFMLHIKKQSTKATWLPPQRNNSPFEQDKTSDELWDEQDFQPWWTLKAGLDYREVNKCQACT